MILLRVPVPYSDRKLPPFIFDISTGTHILPSLYISGAKYPDEMNMPRAVQLSRVKVYLKAKSKQWAKQMWKFIILIVIEDVRLLRPLGRWTHLIKLSLHRRKYAFFFSKLLKKSNETGNYVYDVKGTIDPAVVIQLYSIEMQLPISTTLMFRTFAVMVCAVKDFNDRYRQLHGIQKGSSMGDSKSKLLQWKDIVRIHTEVLETYRALKREDDVDNLDEDEGEDAFDDSVSVLTDDASVFSSTNSVKTGKTTSASPKRESVSLSKQLTSSMGSFSLLNKATSKLLNRRTSSGTLDSVMERHEGSDEQSDSSAARHTSSTSIITPLGILSMPSVPLPSGTPFKSLLGGGSDSRLLMGGSSGSHNITDAIQWVIPRHQSLITIVPPDVYLTVGKFDATFRQPVQNFYRKNICSLSLASINGALSISSPVLGNNQDGSSFDKSIGGFASLAGALIQIRLTVEELKAQMFEGDSTPPVANIVAAPLKKSNQESYPITEDRDESSLSEYNEDGDTIDDNQPSSEFAKFYNLQLQTHEPPPSSTPATPPVQVAVTVFSSQAGKQFLVLCVVLDNDIKVNLSYICSRHAHIADGCMYGV
jgi:hypothetical protein